MEKNKRSSCDTKAGTIQKVLPLPRDASKAAGTCDSHCNSGRTSLLPEITTSESPAELGPAAGLGSVFLWSWCTQMHLPSLQKFSVLKQSGGNTHSTGCRQKLYLMTNQICPTRSIVYLAHLSSCISVYKLKIGALH